MPTPTISGTVVIGTPPAVAVMRAWKASRFGTPPAYDTAFPDSDPPDAGPVNTGTGFGSIGSWRLTLPTAEPYWISADYNSHRGWEYNETPGGLAGPAGTPGIDASNTLAGLYDVALGSQTDSQYLGWNPAVSGGRWVPMSVSGVDVDTGGSGTLAGLTDVVVGTPADDDVLSWDTATGKWVSEAIAGAGASTLAALTDVTIGTPTDAQALAWNAATSKWTPQTISGGGGGDTAWHIVGAAGEPAFENGWGNFDTAGPMQRSARFRKTADGMIVLAGVISGGSDGSTAFTLPAGYRRTVDQALSGRSGSVRDIGILHDGSVQPGTSWFSIDCIAFFADA